MAEASGHDAMTSRAESVQPTGGVRGGIGLAAERLGHGPDVLVTTASDHVALRTPTRPDHFSGNAIHLYRPPDHLQPWIDRHRTSIGAIVGVRRTFLAWELDGDHAGTDPDTLLPDDAPAASEVDLVSVMVWRPDLAVEDHAARGDALAALPDAPRDVRSGADEHVLAGARALYLQAGWGTDGDYWRWHTAQQLDLMVARRASVWVAYVVGIPATRASVMHDRGGLAVIEDVVTHPLHRGQGLASALVAHSLRAHLTQRPTDTMVIRASADGAARRVYERLGFMTVATDVSFSLPLPAAGSRPPVATG